MIAASAFFASAIFAAPLSLAAEALSLVPGGEVVGIDVRSDGVIVTELTDVETASGPISPAKDAGILPGDVIVRIGTEEINCGCDLMRALEGCAGSTTVQVERCGSIKQFSITPCISSDGRKTIGVWVRDGLSGIGTITFFNPEDGSYGALGHEICDVDTQILFPLENGNIMTADLTETVKATGAAPGQLHGVFSESGVIGDVKANTGAGIFGTISDASAFGGTEALPVAGEDEVHPGGAVILSTVDGGGVKEYEINITRVLMGAEHGSRNLMFSVTDEALLEKTGGIVQGMSGSPVIQDGRIVGAVTHVLMNNPAKGYGIFIGNMLDSIENAA